MSARSSVAANVCPFLSRLVLGVTFIWFGIPKFQSTEFRGEQAQMLIDMGVVPAPAPAGATPPPPTDDSLLPGVDDVEDPNTPADEAAEEETGTPDESTGGEDDGDVGDGVGGGGDDASAGSGAGEPSASPGVIQDDPGVEPLPDLVEEETGEQEQDQPAIEDEGVEAPGDEAIDASQDGADSGAAAATPPVDPNLTVKALGLHNITLLLRDVNHVYPVVFAWVGALTELLGGAMILIGLLGRVWGLGLAVAMGYAFYLTAVPALAAAFDAAAADPVLNTYEALRGIDFNMQAGMFWQVALFVLAFNIFIGGPGALSLDRILFSRGRSDQRVTVDED